MRRKSSAHTMLSVAVHQLVRGIFAANDRTLCAPSQLSLPALPSRITSTQTLKRGNQSVDLQSSARAPATAEREASEHRAIAVSTFQWGLDRRN